MENNPKTEPSNDLGQETGCRHACWNASGIAGHISKCKTLEEGTSASIHWLNS